MQIVWSLNKVFATFCLIVKYICLYGKIWTRPFPSRISPSSRSWTKTVIFMHFRFQLPVSYIGTFLLVTVFNYKFNGSKCLEVFYLNIPRNKMWLRHAFCDAGLPTFALEISFFAPFGPGLCTWALFWLFLRCKFSIFSSINNTIIENRRGTRHF